MCLIKFDKDHGHPIILNHIINIFFMHVLDLPLVFPLKK